MTKTKKKGKLKRFLLYTFLLVLAIGSLAAYVAWKAILSPNVKLEGKPYRYVYIRTGSSYDAVLKQLEAEGIISDAQMFDWVAGFMKYPEKVKPGKYRVENGWSNRQLIGILRSGRQETVNLVLRATGDAGAIVSLVKRNLEADSAEFASLITSDSAMKAHGFTEETVMSMFIPNTYEFYWNTSAPAVYNRLFSEYEKFWEGTRDAKAAEVNLTRQQVSTLASIVEKETQRRDEMPVVAGVYMNRLRLDMKLDADPTVIFAAHDTSIRRVTKALLEIDSRYNTYRYKGLPPGPICIPSVAAIDAVLNRQPHDYLFFCAKEDFSGYHNFAVTVEQHLVNARKFQQELNRRKIFR